MEEASNWANIDIQKIIHKKIKKNAKSEFSRKTRVIETEAIDKYHFLYIYNLLTPYQELCNKNHQTQCIIQ